MSMSPSPSNGGRSFDAKVAPDVKSKVTGGMSILMYTCCSVTMILANKVSFVNCWCAHILLSVQLWYEMVSLYC
jgi:hypothetical protein